MEKKEGYQSFLMITGYILVLTFIGYNENKNLVYFILRHILKATLIGIMYLIYLMQKN